MDHHQSHLHPIKKDLSDLLAVAQKLSLLVSILFLNLFPVCARGDEQPASSISEPTSAPAPTPTSIPNPSVPLQEEQEPPKEELPRWVPILSIGLPVPLSLGVHYSINPEFSAFFTAGYSPIPFVLRGQLRAGSLEASGRWHPFQGAFFLSSGLGYQSILYNTTLNLGSFSGEVGPAESTLYFNSVYFALGVGWLWKLSRKLYLGFDIGVQIPFVALGGIKLKDTSDAGKSLESASTDALSYYSSFVMPRITILRVGWAF